MLSAAGALLSIAWLSAGSQSPSTTPSPGTPGGQSDTATEAEARALCVGCHLFPAPDILPRSAWRDEIVRMTLIREGQPEPQGPPGTAARMIRLPGDMQRVLRYYLAQAPDALPAPTAWPAADATRFTVRTFSPPKRPRGPAISHVRVVDLDGDGALDIAASDMRFGMILRGRPSDPTGALDVVANVPHPAHFAVYDLDKDGTTDLLVADLGRFLPSDHTDGSVVWLRGTKNGSYAPLSIDGRPRVADVEAGDFDGDGRPDLVMAAFGWRKVGRMSVLENRSESADRPTFVEHVIDPRPGGIHGIPVDISGDGRPDIVGLLAQQFEVIVAYINTGKGFTFDPQVIYTAPHPNWGSSGIQLVDMDGDRDLDVLFTHGDTFDDKIIKPYHGIQWLENKGSFPFEEHRVADLPGVFGAKAGDLDGDGDLDIVACAFLAGGSEVDDSDMPALVWLEQVKPGRFERRTLARRPPRHATLDLADVNSDGALDILVGNFTSDPVDMPWLELWVNKGKDGR
jgi:FG-GAP-like repeat